MILSTIYKEDIDIYDLAQYIDKLILEIKTEDNFIIESAILEIRLQILEEKIILEIPDEKTNDPNLQDILSSYNITPLRKE